MDSNLYVLMVQSLKGHNRLVGEAAGVEGKGKVNRAVCFVRRELRLGGDFFAVNQQFLAGGLVHQHSLDSVSFAWGQVRVGHCVDKRDFLQRVNLFFSVHGGLGLDLRLVRLLELHCLVFVRDVRMNGYLFVVMV